MASPFPSVRGVDFCIRCGILHRHAIDAAQGLVPDATGTGDCPGAHGAR